VKQSSTPANCKTCKESKKQINLTTNNNQQSTINNQEERTFLGTRAETMPVPLGAGTRRTVTEPHFPVTFIGTVCGFPILLPQYPRRTGTIASFAKIIAARIAVATSLEHFTPNPTCPFYIYSQSKKKNFNNNRSLSVLEENCNKHTKTTIEIFKRECVGVCLCVCVFVCEYIPYLQSQHRL
jgi:hypothetical protein